MDRRMYRNREETLKDHLKNPKKKSKTYWYKNKNCDGILKINFLPGNILKRRIQNRIENEDFGDNIKVKVIEKTGPQLKSIITNQSNPWKPNNCQRFKCLLCGNNEEGSNGMCWLNNVTYKISL